MTPREFCYWLQGFFEIKGQLAGKVEPLTAEQTAMIRDHLQYVFTHMSAEQARQLLQPQPQPVLGQQGSPLLPVGWPHPLETIVTC